MSRTPTRVFRLAGAFDHQTLRRLAGPGTFRRGEDYFAGGRVRELDEDERGTVVAQVRGSSTYAVKLWPEKGELAYSCACPRGDDGEFCKHCVAVGLAVLAGAAKPPKARPPRRRVTLADVREYLAREEKEVLVELLMERAVWDEKLQEQLVLRTAKSRQRPGIDVEAMKQALDEAIDPGEFLAWNEVRAYARGVEDTVGTVASVLEEGHAAEAVVLAEHALAAVEVAMDSLDDSGGYMRSVIEGFQDLHLRACLKARPDAVALARRLFARETASEYDVFSDAAQTHAEVLGKEGLAEYRRLAQGAWAKVPAIGPGEKDPDRYGERFRISSILLALARLEGDVDAQVEVLRKDLSLAHGFLRIAEVYRGAGRHDAALEWAEKGLAAFPERADPRLREFVAEEYHRRERHAEAVGLAWTAFSERPGPEAYRDLKRHADRAGGWSSWRDQAWELMRKRLQDRRQAAGRTPGSASVADRSVLVEILLGEEDVEAAWNEARAGGCSQTLWLTLAEQREGEHPAEAVPIYQRSVDLTLRRADKDAYAEAVRLLKRVRQAMRRAGTPEAFGPYLSSIRAAHARKRSFVRLLERANWGETT